MTDLSSLRDRTNAQAQPGAAEYARLAREIRNLDGAAGIRELRVAILGSCTLNFVDPYLVVEGYRRHLLLRTHYGPFGQVEQQITNPGSALYQFDPDAVLIVIRPEDVDPDCFARHHSERQQSRSLASVVERLIDCATAFRAQSRAPVLVANIAHPSRLPLGPFDANIEDSVTYAVDQANRALRAGLEGVAGAVVWDYAGLVRSAGADQWSDPRLWALARVPVASDKQPVLARHLARSLSALMRPPAKCLVLDLDNSLWGGVIGDDGIEGIQLGDDYPGNVFKSFQRAVLGLADRGILLAIASKNYPDVVDRALREHPEMLIRPEHIAAMRVNWNAKSGNLREIAAELNIGADALVHFDDSPVERAEIAANAPEVNVIDVPTDPLRYEQALYECGFFDAVSLSREDRQRVEMYRTERARENVRAAAGSEEDFLVGLGMVAEVGAVDDVSIGRVAQLIEKTNQFNLTTRRHSRADISRMAHDPHHVVIDLRLRDRFGDLGLIAVGIMSVEGDSAVIDTLLMSCRAMGRRAEHALVSELVRVAKERGCSSVVGDYIPTPRNGIVADLYSLLDFASVGALDGGTRFRLDLDTATIEWPSMIARVDKTSAIPA